MGVLALDLALDLVQDNVPLYPWILVNREKDISSLGGLYSDRTSSLIASGMILLLHRM
jgi:hypothetical protein